MDTHPSTAWTPTRDAALARLQAYLPSAGRDYSRSRNHDFGPQRRGNVSTLSPWIRHRLISEAEVLEGVIGLHGTASAEKFIQEVFWRTYWKGWLEMRPGVWEDYRKEVEDQFTALDANQSLMDAYAQAVEGSTGIACMDAWIHELHADGYLHNHARMWFASIWIHTLNLPWTLGADLFMRQLLDGDPASNTLSWRWVAGRQTLGKTYLARADNIHTFTNGRFSPEPRQLAAQAPAPANLPQHPRPTALPAPGMASAGLRCGILLTEEDLDPMSAAEHLAGMPDGVVAVAGSHFATRRSPRPVSDHVLRFTAGALDDALARAGEHWSCPRTLLPAAANARQLLDWAASHGIEQIATPWAAVGPARSALKALHPQLAAAGVDLIMLRREWDNQCWPHASHGFFRFRQEIPPLLQQLLP